MLWLLAMIAIGVQLAMLLVLLKVWRSLHWLWKGQKQVLVTERHQTEGRQYLATLLDQPAETLPPSGGWAASTDFLILLAEKILCEKPETVVEFGSGITTLVIARCLRLNGRGKLISYDHDAAFAEVTRRRAERLGLPHDVRTVRLIPASALGYAGVWYEMPGLPETIDLLVIDGPPRPYHPETRGGAGAIFSRLSPGGAILLDDASRPGEQAVAARWRREFPHIQFTSVSTEKGTLIGHRSDKAQ